MRRSIIFSECGNYHRYEYNLPAVQEFVPNERLVFISSSASISKWTESSGRYTNYSRQSFTLTPPKTLFKCQHGRENSLAPTFQKKNSFPRSLSPSPGGYIFPEPYKCTLYLEEKSINPVSSILIVCDV